MIKQHIGEAETELFTAVYKRINNLGYSVYIFKPDKVPYPFIHIGETLGFDEEDNKTKIRGRVIQTIDIWHNELLELGTVNSIATAIKNELRQIRRTQNFQWTIAPYGLNTISLIDNSTNVRLRRYRIDVEFRYT